MRRISLLTVLGALLALSVSACEQPVSAPLSRPTLSTDIFLRPEIEVVEARVPRNATLAGILRSHQIGEQLIYAIVEQANAVFDVRRIRADNPYRLVRTIDGLLRQFDYHIDADNFLRIVRQSSDSLAFEAEVVPYTKERAVIAIRGDIDRERSSLVAAIDDAGEQVQLAMAMADVFGGEIDFNNDLRQGDNFQVLFEKFLRDDEFAGYGDVLAAEFNNDGRRVLAFLYTPPGGRPGYYDGEGRSLKRLFLRSPLRFEPRVTSRFSRRRMHPILGEYRAHLGVDYGAPRGAPVVSVANGRVVSAARSGGSGRMVRIRHAGGYETYYLHLSSFANGMRPGARIAQGQLIGRVGATGLATGPHLDYRLKKNGVFVNPLTEHRKMPPGEPIPAAHLGAFHAERDHVLSLLLGAREPALTADDAAAGAP